jgi:lipopolysaccharide export system protein LptA
MLADDGSREINFSGKVVARQGNLIISCDRMKVKYVPAPPREGRGDAGTEAAPGARSSSPLDGGQEIDQVDCEGAVKIQQGERLAVADYALYLARALPRRLVLTGSARVWEGESSVTGHRITYYLDENRSQVDGSGSGRVRAFYSREGER